MNEKEKTQSDTKAYDLGGDKQVLERFNVINIIMDISFNKINWKLR